MTERIKGVSALLGAALVVCIWESVGGRRRWIRGPKRPPIDVKVAGNRADWFVGWPFLPTRRAPFSFSAARPFVASFISNRCPTSNHQLLSSATVLTRIVLRTRA
uniref:Secreted protein n=1 Tax=Plectus sambesii TaxID=2011161 RepID=A0A914W8Z9_9BILA